MKRYCDPAFEKTFPIRLMGDRIRYVECFFMQMELTKFEADANA